MECGSEEVAKESCAVGRLLLHTVITIVYIVKKKSKSNHVKFTVLYNFLDSLMATLRIKKGT